MRAELVQCGPRAGRLLSWLLPLGAVLAGPVCGDGAEPGSAGPVGFEKDVLPLLRARCHGCHGDRKQEAGLDLRTQTAVLKGGKSGPALRPGDAENSLPWQRLRDG